MESSRSTKTWPSILTEMTERAAKEGILDSLGHSNNDFLKPIQVLQDQLFIKRRCASWLSACLESPAQKSGSLASRLRDEGNEAFARRDFATAARLYTESLICAPKTSPELSLAYGNRSAALFHLERHQLVVRDVDLALKHSFASASTLKLHQRRARSLGLLGRHQEALDSLLRALENVEETRFPTEARKTATVRDLKALINESKIAVVNNENGSGKENETKDEEENKWNESCFSSFVANPDLPGASDQLALSHHPRRNRCIMTTAALPIGSVLFEESPYCSVLLPEQASSHCHHCHGKIQAPVACLRCTQPRYCSESCRSQSWSEYHQFECYALHLLQSIGVAHLALRIVLRAGKQRVLRIAKTSNIEDSSKNDINEDKAYKSVWELETHKQGREELFQYAATAVLLSMFLSQRTEFFSKKGVLDNNKEGDKVREEVDLIASVMLKHIVQMVNNASAIYEVGEDRSEESDQANDNDAKASRVYATVQYRIATAIYPSASMMNHSCEPSVINSFLGGRRLVVRSVKALAKNEEVFNCYGPHYARHGRQERLEMLKSQYNFDCDCKRCVDNEYELKFSAFKCPLCDKGLMPDPFTLRQRSKGDKEFTSKCLKCDRESDLSHVVGPVFNAQKLHEKAKEYIDQGALNEALRCLQRCLSLRQQVMVESNQQITATLDQLAWVYAMMEDFEKSLQCVNKCLPIVEERYGPYSIEVGHEVVKQSDLLLITDPIKAVKSLKRALQIFSLHYGNCNDSVREIKEKLAALDGQVIGRI